MKKLFLLLAATSSVLFTNCTSSDPIEYDKANPSITAERIPGINSALPDAWELEISGNTLNKIKINSSQEDRFTYAGGHIVEVNHFQNGTYVGLEELTYNADGSIMAITSKNGSGVVTITKAFNYSNPNLIEEVVSIYNTTTGLVEGNYTTYKSIVNGNLIQYKFGIDYQTDTMIYDNKLNVFSNLQCLNELILYYSNDKVSKNNRITTNSVFTYNGSVVSTSSINYLNQYDLDNRITKTNVTSNNASYIQNHTY